MRAQPKRLIGESLREIAVLILVFVPLDFSLAERLTIGVITFSVVVGGALLIWGIFLEDGAR